MGKLLNYASLVDTSNITGEQTADVNSSATVGCKDANPVKNWNII